MKRQRQLITSECPVALRTGVYPEYQREGIAIENGHIILCRKGSATFNVDFYDYHQEAGTMALLFSGDINMLKDVSEDLEVEYLVFSDDILREAMIGIPSVEDIRQYPVIRHEEVTEMTEALFSFVRQSAFFGKTEDIRRICILQLRSFFDAYVTWLISHGFSKSVFPTRTAELFAKFLSLLTHHYKESRQVSFYADKMGMTSRYLSNIVTAETGRSAKDAIDEYVVMQIRLALQHEEKTINSIAWDFNFSSLAYFSDYFKQHTGMSPQKYRDS